MKNKPKCDRNCFSCRFPDCIDNSIRMTDFELMCLAIGHAGETKEQQRTRKNSDSREYYRKHREEVLRKYHQKRQMKLTYPE